MKDLDAARQYEIYFSHLEVNLSLLSIIVIYSEGMRGIGLYTAEFRASQV